MVDIRRMGPQIGVEVTDVDVKTLDDAGFAPIYQAWLDCNILVVRDQELEIKDFLRYSRRFGPVIPHPSKSTRHPEIPEITMLGINKFDADGKINNAIYRRGAEGWHTDGAYNQAPFKATQLYALAIPSRGGDTLFANGYAAYDALPERLKRRLDGVKGAFAYGGRRGGSLEFRVGEKGGVSVYGLGRFPVTLYYEQWTRLLDATEKLREFIEDNKSKLKLKDQ